MEIRQLQTFLTIVKHNNFTKAAEELGYAQSTVTTQIKKLEEHFDKKLFERIGRNIFLTEYGKKLLPIAKKMNQLSEDANDLISDEDKASGILKIATPESLCFKWFPYIYKNMNVEYPEIDIELIIHDCSDYVELLRSNVVDLAYVISENPISEEFIVLGQWDVQMNLLVSPNHHLSSKSWINYEDLNEQRFILTEKDCCYHNAIESLISRQRIHPKEIMSVKNIQVIKQLVMNQYGMTFLPDFAVNDELNSGDICSLKWEGCGVNFQTSLICHRDKWITPKIDAFTQIAKRLNNG